MYKNNPDSRAGENITGFFVLIFVTFLLAPGMCGMHIVREYLALRNLNFVPPSIPNMANKAQFDTSQMWTFAGFISLAIFAGLYLLSKNIKTAIKKYSIISIIIIGLFALFGFGFKSDFAKRFWFYYFESSEPSMEVENFNIIHNYQVKNNGVPNINMKTGKPEQPLTGMLITYNLITKNLRNKKAVFQCKFCSNPNKFILSTEQEYSIDGDLGSQKLYFSRKDYVEYLNERIFIPYDVLQDHFKSANTYVIFSYLNPQTGIFENNLYDIWNPYNGKTNLVPINFER